MSIPHYQKYKKSDQDWLGDVPDHWSLKRLGQHFDERREKASDKEFQPLSVTKSGIVPRLETAAKTQDGDNRKKVLKGDFVINSRSDRKGSAGLSPLDGSVSLICTVLLPVNIDGGYVHHLLRSELFQEEYYRRGKGIVADLWSTNFADMKNIILAVPPMPEQTQIARFLDHETARIDALIEEQQRLIELLKEKRQALTLQAFQQNCPELRLEHAVDVIKRPVAQMEGEMYTRLGLYNRGRGLFHKDPCGMEDMGDSDFFWIQDGDLIISGQFAWEGAVALAGSREKGTVVSHRYPVLRGKKNGVRTEYIYSLLTTKHGDFLLNEHSRGAAGRNRPLNLSSLMKEKLYIPPGEVQDKIAKLVHEEANVKKVAKKQIDLLNERRSALISAAVTGKIDVRNWQPAQPNATDTDDYAMVAEPAAEYS